MSLQNNKMHTAIAERNALAALGGGHPGIVRLHSTFQDDWRLYFVLDYAKNGEMKTLLNKLGSLSLPCSRHYAAQLVDTIEYMHSKGVIHRDLKPENLLLDDNHRMKICDFGTGKVLETGVDRAQTWVGTAQYIAPELLEAKETSKSSDFWALGCIIYQLIAGRFAFQGLSDFLTWQKIKKLDYSFPEGFDNEAKDLIQKLLVREPTERLGVGSPGSENDIKALKSHPFFKSINWDKLWTDPVPPLEAGLFKKEHPLPPSNDQIWDDVEAAWDDIMAEDEMSWASDAEGPDYLIHTNGHLPTANQIIQQDQLLGIKDGELLGPTDVPPSLQARRGTNSTIQGVEEIKRQLVKEQTGKESPSAVEDSPTTGTSSSEGSRGIVAAATSPVSVTLSSPSQTTTHIPSQLQDPAEGGRGRNPALSPKQGHGPSPESDFAKRLKLPLGESVLFDSVVEERSMKRRASKLIPLVPHSKAKTRQLVLTSKRLLCLKQKQRQKPQDISVKFELALKASEKLKEKDKEKESRGIIATVQRKGEREFVVLTTTKMYNFAAPTSDLAQQWFNKLDDALVSHGRKQSQPRT
ncbi:kinase-like protein [Macrolepiota fuliginosa MF-IS2]|uniref:non-specific serine/threonine protein kinase n=1 Tax=Macrolepiota fuliginosa MF-IS2 TaxID=1400762 RepID=A0A9P5XLD7_9AGAR|nr:kinase-like protein [Macrolepiota fuliginosa MF-IS2]